MLARTSSIRAGRPVPSRHLHRQSTGALTSRAAFTPTTPHLRSRLVAQVKVALSEVQASMRSDRRPSSDNGSRMHGRATLCGKGSGEVSPPRVRASPRARVPPASRPLRRSTGEDRRTPNPVQTGHGLERPRLVLCSQRNERQGDAEFVEDRLGGERLFDVHRWVGAQHPAPRASPPRSPSARRYIAMRLSRSLSRACRSTRTRPPGRSAAPARGAGCPSRPWRRSPSRRRRTRCCGR